jgi:hypothetical protein
VKRRFHSNFGRVDRRFGRTSISAGVSLRSSQHQRGIRSLVEPSELPYRLVLPLEVISTGAGVILHIVAEGRSIQVALNSSHSPHRVSIGE